MTAKKKPARVPRTTVTGWGVLLLPWNDADKPLLLRDCWHGGLQLPNGVASFKPLMFTSRKEAAAWWRVKRTSSAHWMSEKVRIVRITGTYEEAK